MSSTNKEDIIPEEDNSRKMEVEKPIEPASTETEKKEEEKQNQPNSDKQAATSEQNNSTAMQAEEEQVNKKEENNNSHNQPPKVDAKPADSLQELTKVYNYGSTEMDQFWLPDSRSETRRPYLNACLKNHVVVQIACGSLHTLILTNLGLVYSQGQNDDGALGRPANDEDEDSDKKAQLVQIPIKVNMIAAGDSHSVAANSELGVCFFWGTYRNTEKANLAPPARTPVRVGNKELYRKKLTKILSGQQHSLVLTDEGELFGWGDPDMGVVGRMPKTRHGYEQALKVAKITQIKVSDIYTGGRHSFLKRQIKKAIPASDGVEEQKAEYAYYSWGLNNFGQLGLDLPEERHLDVVFEPTQIKFFDNLEVKKFCGGESHSIALLEDGTVYGFGRNDIGQFGLGKVKDNHPVYGEIKEINPKPIKIDTFPADHKKIINIWAGANYSYAQEETGQCYSWGFGSNFVLGNRKDEDEDEYNPYVIPRDFYKNEIPTDFAMGTQHVTYYVNLEQQQHSVPKDLLLDADDEYLPHNMRKKTTALAKAAAEKAEKEERAAKRAEEAAKKKEAEAAKKQAEAEKKAEKEKERLAKKQEKEQAEAEKKREKSQPKKEEKQEAEKGKKKTENKKKEEPAETKKRATSSSSKKNGKSESNSKSRSKSKPKTSAASSSKSKSQSKERTKAEDKKAPAKASTASKGKSNGSSSKKKASDEEHAKVSQSKNNKQLKKEPATKKK
ncbi:chromosome condensation regulator RCC1 repeat protein (macronuclear) [Tetrahymena thermophila SB210]|uniref:Chromosome condensation regulator RCC1 repeat protein n=1 Tax=Tetrahymena thermophila (strain SB210) TaxID=312017 RepID=I7LZX3_TETTS|nr:chromosome condensation regulator RCC1 repeat protein [Tetrahymena thermophila SB210]EAR85080.3 chromosome condensation regulator RCC1 repeat protein [Tetrahymena thermophila SB210]|eukprot:XP_001032743.3 chromosome condensation regulator RCC1 repeat protein [Tetrahymena thermophila SB210]